MTTTPGDEIVYRTTPGGELWHPTGTPQDEATAAASDSIHRQLGAQVEEVRALAESAGGLPDGGAPGDLLTRTVDGHTWSTPVKPPAQVSILGPGRPDDPSTTAGAITGAEPVGTEYRSTDGANVGAYVWMKRPGGKWEVTDGDTGLRKLMAELAQNGAALDGHGGGVTQLSRSGNLVNLVLAVRVTGWVSGNAFMTIPPGFQSAASIYANGGYSGDPAAQMVIAPTRLNLYRSGDYYFRGTWSWYTKNPWPTFPLPGTPA